MPKEQFLEAYDREHQTTMRVLRNYPPEKHDFRPHPNCRTAKELAWTFVTERGLGTMVFDNEFEEMEMSRDGYPTPPESWDELLRSLEVAHAGFSELIASTPREEPFQIGSPHDRSDADG